MGWNMGYGLTTDSKWKAHPFLIRPVSTATCSLYIRRPTCTAHGGNLSESWQRHRCFWTPMSFSAAFRWFLFLLASLSFGISISWDLLLLTLRPLHVPFSWYGLLLTYLFLYPFVLTACYFETAKELPSTTLYYKACTKYFPALLRTTELAQSTSQHYFVLQNLHNHKVLPSTVSHYKVCAKYFQALLWNTLYKVFTEKQFLHREAFTQRSFSSQNILRRIDFTPQDRIPAPKRQKTRFWSTFFERKFGRKIISAKMDKNLLTNHRRNLDAATPIRLTAIRWWNLGGALSQSSMGHGCPMVSMIEKKNTFIYSSIMNPVHCTSICTSQNFIRNSMAIFPWYPKIVRHSHGCLPCGRGQLVDDVLGHHWGDSVCGTELLVEGHNPWGSNGKNPWKAMIFRLAFTSRDVSGLRRKVDLDTGVHMFCLVNFRVF